jgi:hypothetical protein
MESLWRFSAYVAKSGLAPKGIQTQEAIFVAIQMGLEVGLTPMAALQNIAVINGRPSIWGDAQLAIVRRTGLLEIFDEWYEVKGARVARNPSEYTPDVTAVCRVKRAGYPPQEVAFSVADSKMAKLWGKEGPWTTNPGRMIKYRARAFCLRDAFGDALKGMLTAEEAGDLDKIRNVSPGRGIAQFVGAGNTDTVEQESSDGTSESNPPPSAKTFDGMPEAKLTPGQKLGSILESKGYTFAQFHEAAVADDKITIANAHNVKSMADVPPAVVAHYLGADGSGSEALRSIAHLLGVEGVTP